MRGVVIHAGGRDEEVKCLIAEPSQAEQLQQLGARDLVASKDLQCEANEARVRWLGRFRRVAHFKEHLEIVHPPHVVGAPQPLKFRFGDELQVSEGEVLMSLRAVAGWRRSGATWISPSEGHLPRVRSFTSWGDSPCQFR